MKLALVEYCNGIIFCNLTDGVCVDVLQHLLLYYTSLYKASHPTLLRNGYVLTDMIFVNTFNPENAEKKYFLGSPILRFKMPIGN